MKFDQDQIKFLKRIGVSINFSEPLSDADYELIEEKVSDHLQRKGFSKEYEPTEDGKMCESILDML